MNGPIAASMILSHALVTAGLVILPLAYSMAIFQRWQVRPWL
jgi:hypothetical protein